MDKVFLVNQSFNPQVKLSNLNILFIYTMGNLEMIWKLKENFILKSESLEKLSQSEELCTRMISFVNLSFVKVLSGQNLKYVFGKETVEEKETHIAAMEFVFPKLVKLKMCELPQLRAFHPDDGHRVEMPVLNNLKLRNCWTPDHRMQQPLFSVGKVCIYIQSLCCQCVFSF